MLPSNEGSLEYGGRVHNHLRGAFAYPLHGDALESDDVQATYSRYGTYLCPQAYPGRSADALPLGRAILFLLEEVSHHWKHAGG